MKKIILPFALIAMLFSCSKDEDTKPVDEEGNDAVSLVIKAGLSEHKDIEYTPFSPSVILKGTPDFNNRYEDEYEIDLDKDGESDIKLGFVQYDGTDYDENDSLIDVTYSYVSIQKMNDDFSFSFSSYNKYALYSNGEINAFNEGDIIDENIVWDDRYNSDFHTLAQSSGDFNPEWETSEPAYFAIKLEVDDIVRYGWIKLNTHNVTKLEILGFALEK